MHPKERRERIVHLLEQNDRVTVQELRREFGVSAPTLYKDLETLSRENRVRRSYGEIRLTRDDPRRHDFFEQLEANPEKKRHIARIAAGLVRDGETLFLDASSTTFYLCAELKRRKLEGITLITNSLLIPVEFLSFPDFRVIALGGVLDRETAGFSSPHPERHLENLRGDTFFFSAAAVSPERGILDAYILGDVRIKQLFFANAEQAVCLADSTKFGKHGTVNWLSYDRLKILVTDPGLEPEVRAALEARGVRVLS
jgi:DeoR/GlpR family transcriptional regulator of sugar metabolism